MNRRLIFLAISFCLTLISQAQLRPNKTPTSNLRSRIISTRPDTLSIDSLTLIPNSWTIEGVSPNGYRILPGTSLLVWVFRPSTDSVRIQYRTFPFNLSQTQLRNRYDTVKDRFYVMPFAGNAPGEDRSGLGGWSFGNIQADGSIGRQLGFGNAQDAVVNSSLNLQLSGILGDSILMEAAITDNNLPIQPDGSTQQLNEFDQVFIRFQKDAWQVNLGDIDIRESRSHYLRFYKRMQGLTFQNKYSLGNGWAGKSLVSASIAKGKFTRQEILPIEGNQGPYRMKGPNGEFFFVVLANSERVYYDGTLMQRGEDQDYVINYNTGEITFTPKRMITKDSRLQVEFEYAERNYLNSNLFLFQEMDNGKKWKFFIGAFSNTDAKNSPINQVLDARQKQFLSGIGDSIQKAFYPTEMIDTFASNKILYEKVYTGIDSFYRYSTDPSLARFRLAFTDLGPGNGDYLPELNGANGKVYRYVAPIGGVRQGRFEPIQLLIAPRQQQVMNAGFKRELVNGSIQAEVSTSNVDVNTFSQKNGKDDRGWAGKVKWTDLRNISFSGKLKSDFQLDGEWVDARFRPLERLRSIEFTRDWGLDALPNDLFAKERIMQGSWTLSDPKAQEFKIRAVHYSRGMDYSGFQTQISHRNHWKGWQLEDQFTRTKFTRSNLRGDFIRPRLDLSKELKDLWKSRLGVNYQMEKNQIWDRNMDTILINSFYFDVWTAYWHSPDQWKNRWNLQFFTRADRAATPTQWKMADRSLNGNLQFSLERSAQRQFFANLNLRRLKVIDPFLSRQKDESTFLGRLEYVFREYKGLIQGNALYEAGTGQEQRRDFSYFEVPAGQGEYAWFDYNSDGIQQLNEFERAIYPDQAKFIRIYTPTNQFIKANYSNFNYRLELSPRNHWQGKSLTGIKKFITRWGYFSNLLMNQKQLAGGSPLKNPFGKTIGDTSLIQQQSSWTHTLTYNRFSSSAGADLTYYRNAGKSLLTYGYESRVTEEWMLKARWNLNQNLTWQFLGKTGIQGLFTPSFANRNYRIDYVSCEPALSWIRSTRSRVTGSYRYSNKKNGMLYGGERAVSHSLLAEGRWNRWQNSSLNGRVNYQSIRYPHQANTTVSFMMLEGLLPGKNWIWSLGFTKRLVNNLELNIQYDGRKAGLSRVVHLGRAGVTALF